MIPWVSAFVNEKSLVFSKKTLANSNRVWYRILAGSERSAKQGNIRVWRSLVSRLNGVQEAAGSNPVTRTTSEQALYRLLRLFFKSQSALMPLLLLSKSNPLALGFDLVFSGSLKSYNSTRTRKHLRKTQVLLFFAGLREPAASWRRRRVKSAAAGRQTHGVGRPLVRIQSR